MNTISYKYVHSRTDASTGYFSCEPEPLPSLQKLAALLLERPLDTFLRRHAVNRLLNHSQEEIAALFSEAAAEPRNPAPGAFADALLDALLRELALLRPDKYRAKSPANPPEEAVSGLSPLLLLRRAGLPDAELHAAWAARFAENIHGHRALPPLEEIGLPPLFTSEELAELIPAVKTLPEMAAAYNSPAAEAAAPEPLSAGRVAELALERLLELGIAAGPEQRHLSSLSPVALLMPWSLKAATRCGRNNHELSGEAVTYGRGLSLEQARASCRMEMVERASAYLSSDGSGVLDRLEPGPLLHLSETELRERGMNAVNPGDFYLEVPYRDEKLHWMRGSRVTGRAGLLPGVMQEVWVPFQMVSLFSNLDEPDLCSAPGSTGLATGVSQEQARLAALVEILERNAEATTVYDKARCFVLEADEKTPPPVGMLLEDYARHGINVQFMDMTGPLGVPCYQSFVIGPRGTIHRGHGAGLSGAGAVLSALTETPYPYPGGGASGPAPRKLPARKFGDLPDFSQGSTAANLALLETLLCANGLNPVYVDITHAGLKFPVVRALVPGMQPSADFDEFSRISPRLFQSYLDYLEGRRK